MNTGANNKLTKCDVNTSGGRVAQSGFFLRGGKKKVKTIPGVMSYL